MIRGSCHCGAVRVELAKAPEQITNCNCSICHRLGTLWAYYAPSEVTLACAEGATLIYQCNSRALEFHFCKTCGCTTHWAYADKSKATRMAINARLFDPAVLDGVRVKHLNGDTDWSERFGTFPF